MYKAVTHQMNDKRKQAFCREATVTFSNFSIKGTVATCFRCGGQIVQDSDTVKTCVAMIKLITAASGGMFI